MKIHAVFEHLLKPIDVFRHNLEQEFNCSHWKKDFEAVHRKPKLN